MGIFSRKREERASGAEQFDDALLRAVLSGTGVTKETALQVPTVSGGIDLIANIVASTPIKLYTDAGGRASEVKDDPRIRLLNDETGDTLNSNEFWKAIVRDYYLGKGGYAYIHKEKGRFKSLHYVDETQIAVQKNTDPVFKDFDIFVQGQRYRPFEFLKILRNTKDGAEGIPITTESSKLIEVAYQSLCFESYLVKKGGNKKGFLKSKTKLSEEAMTALKKAYADLYSNSSDNVVVLNNGIEFQESSNTSTEMQLNENKVTNAEEFAKIFHVSTGAMSGKASDSDISSIAKLAAIPLMTTIQCALNKDLLLEKEKGEYYWAFDTKELLKGDMKERFEAYKTALESNFMGIDEVRYAEDMEPLGLSWIRLGLNDVLYDPKTKTIYTPNTNKTSVMGVDSAEEASDETGDTEPEMPDAGSALLPASRGGIMESRANPYHDQKNGRFTSGPGGGGGSGGKEGKLRSRSKKSGGPVRMSAAERTRVSHQIATDMPGLKADGTVYSCFNRKHYYTFTVKETGTYSFKWKIKIEGNEKRISGRKEG